LPDPWHLVLKELPMPPVCPGIIMQCEVCAMLRAGMVVKPELNERTRIRIVQPRPARALNAATAVFCGSGTIPWIASCPYTSAWCSKWRLTALLTGSKRKLAIEIENSSTTNPVRDESSVVPSARQTAVPSTPRMPRTPHKRKTSPRPTMQIPSECDAAHSARSHARRQTALRRLAIDPSPYPTSPVVL